MHPGGDGGGPGRIDTPPEADGRNCDRPGRCVLGLLQTDRDPPDDDECRRIVEKQGTVRTSGVLVRRGQPYHLAGL